ncbi:MAG TPA: hypothetical protein VH308_14150 [Terracidiphilus sp.]|jgi:hypothetical protein|nr:hypothetical protein [Terracidiphilus sp.]
MAITVRSLFTLVHGMGFGALYLLACSGAIVELYRRYSPAAEGPVSVKDESFLSAYLVAMSVLAWLTVLSGAYIIYPWYRATPPAGATNLTAFPQRLLMSSPSTVAWHSLGMEWKEHVAWLVPISITMAAFVFIKYGRNLRNKTEVRNTVLCFVLVSFLAAGIAGFFGAMLVKYAPVQGGSNIQLLHGE